MKLNNTEWGCCRLFVYTPHEVHVRSPVWRSWRVKFCSLVKWISGRFKVGCELIYTTTRSWQPSTRLHWHVLWNVVHSKSEGVLISNVQELVRSQRGRVGQNPPLTSNQCLVIWHENTFRFRVDDISTVRATRVHPTQIGSKVYILVSVINTPIHAHRTSSAVAHRLLRRQNDVNSIWLRRYWISTVEHFGSDQVSTVCRSLFHVRNPKTPNFSRELFMQLLQPYESASLKQGQQGHQQGHQQGQQQQQHQQLQPYSGPYHSSSLPSDLAWYRLEKLLNERFCRRSTLWHDIN